MANKQDYLKMMKRMEKGMGEERIPAPMNMGLENMKNLNRMGAEAIPSRLDMGLDSMRQDDSEEMIMRGIQSGKGSMSNAELDAIKNSAMAGMGAMSDTEMKALENALGGSVSDEIREAVSALISMGISLPDALEALNNDIGNSMSTRPETMVEGALGSLPTRTSDSVPDEVNDMFDADRTQSLDMQDSVNT